MSSRTPRAKPVAIVRASRAGSVVLLRAAGADKDLAPAIFADN